MTRIMLVEDDSTMRSLLTTLFGLEGFDTHPFAPMEESALFTQLKIVQPDILMMDVHLKNCSGIEILQKIRSDPDFHHLTVAILSGEDLSAESYGAGANYFILKPFDIDEMIRWLKIGNVGAL